MNIKISLNKHIKKRSKKKRVQIHKESITRRNVCDDCTRPSLQFRDLHF